MCASCDHVVAFTFQQGVTHERDVLTYTAVKLATVPVPTRPSPLRAARSFALAFLAPSSLATWPIEMARYESFANHGTALVLYRPEKTSSTGVTSKKKSKSSDPPT